MSTFKPESLCPPFPITFGPAPTPAPLKLHVYSAGREVMWIDDDGIHIADGAAPTEAAEAFVQVLGQMWDNVVKRAADREVGAAYEAAYDEGYALGYQEAREQFE